MTQELFRKDGYLQQCEATVTDLVDKAFVVDQTVFYPMGGGQPGDSGHAVRENGQQIRIQDTQKDREHDRILHIVEEGEELPALGESLSLHIDWERRYRLMRMHSCLHMLCAVIPAPVTGGSIRDGSGRLDFDLPAPPSREDLEEKLNQAIAESHPMSYIWITDREMQDRPELVKTLSVRPPSGAGTVRLVQFGEADLQACGGTHVANSGEIGKVRVESIKNKGKQNRRITVELA
ncbi:MAG: alanyl-tRNA editing protein [Gammaproteobacteria bacterium]|nr:alanyl-tRNA editing protein [Gammaproteobacteria bacterium]MCY4226273.1 alanyl-tRNA editing protein [Gammaproteobacteria bacterium]